MTAKSTLLKADLSNRVKRSDYRSTNNDASRDILRGLGKSPDRDPNYIPPVPLVGPRLHERGTRDVALPSAPLRLTLAEETIEALVEALVDAIYDRFEGNMANLVQMNAEVNAENLPCATCSHDGCNHEHPPHEMTGAEVEAYLGCTRSTRNTWLHRKEMPPPVSATTPYLWNPHVISCFKLDKRLLLAKGQYDRAEHLRLLPIAAAEHERKRAARSEKLSAHMRRDNARRKLSSKRTTKRGAK